MTKLVPFLFILIYCGGVLLVSASKSLAPHAIKGVIDQHSAENNREIEVINFGEDNGEGEAVMGKLLQLENLSLAINNYRDVRIFPNPEQLQLEFSSVLFFDSPENFKRSLQNVTYKLENPNVHRHLIYIPNIDLKALESFSFDDIDPTQMYFLVHETQQSIDLATPFLFSDTACYKKQWRIINRFTKAQMRWENSNFFVSKYENYHKCPMEIEYFEKSFYATELFSPFEKHLNFTLVVDEDQSSSKFYDLMLYNNAYKHVHNLTIMDFEENKVFIPPGEIYGDYEKMRLPFDIMTWIGIMLMIGCSIVTIILIKCLSKENQRVFFGKNNRSPLLNFISIILNGSQSDNLTENLPRMLMMIFIIWCMIFR
jgi:hypothetical protein